MHPFLRVPAAVATLLIIPSSRIEAQSVRAPAAPQTAAKPSEAAAPAKKPDDQPPVPSVAPQAPTQQPEVAASAEKQADKTAGKSDGGKQEQKDAGDGKPVDEPSLASILPKILLNADADGDGQLSQQEFRQMPLMKELKPERIDSLFAGIDADVNAALSSQELTKGFSLLAQLAKEGRSLLDEKGLLSQAKELKRQVQKTTGINPKSFLLKLIQNADKNGNGRLSTDEFRQLPLLIDLKKERVDSLFGEIDADGDASLTPEEIGNGFGSITSLAREGKSLLDDEDVARLVKKLKPLVP